MHFPNGEIFFSLFMSHSSTVKMIQSPYFNSIPVFESTDKQPGEINCQYHAQVRVIARVSAFVSGLSDSFNLFSTASHGLRRAIG